MTNKHFSLPFTHEENCRALYVIGSAFHLPVPTPTFEESKTGFDKKRHSWGDLNLAALVDSTEVDPDEIHSRACDNHVAGDLVDEWNLRVLSLIVRAGRANRRTSDD